MTYIRLFFVLFGLPLFQSFDPCPLKILNARLYHQPYNESINSKLESIQYNTTLAITKAIKRTSRSKLFKELGLESNDGLSDVSMHFEKYYLPVYLPLLLYPNYFEISKRKLTKLERKIRRLLYTKKKCYI